MAITPADVDAGRRCAAWSGPSSPPVWYFCIEGNGGRSGSLVVMRTTVTDHYTVLGVARTADRRAIQAAYRALARQAHPDFGGDGDEMARINEAWHVLGDARRRAEYDGPVAAAPAGQTAARERRAGSTVLDFGRYDGWTIRDIANADDDYLDWLSRTPMGRPLRREIAEVLDAREQAMAALRPAPAKPSRRWKIR
jgi:DnaJ-like protein/exodeoxyribonuclease X-like protein